MSTTLSPNSTDILEGFSGGPLRARYSEPSRELDFSGDVETMFTVSEPYLICTNYPWSNENPSPVQTWRGIKTAEEAIRFAYENLETNEAISAITGIWELIDRAGELAAARLRILLGRIQKPVQAPAPKWFVVGTDIHNELENPSPNSLKVSQYLIGVCAAKLGNLLPEAEVEVGPNGRIIVEWKFDSIRLQWMIEALDIPWPAVKIYQVLKSVDDDGTARTDSRIYRDAYTAVADLEHLVSQTHRFISESK